MRLMQWLGDGGPRPLTGGRVMTTARSCLTRSCRPVPSSPDGGPCDFADYWARYSRS